MNIFNYSKGINVKKSSVIIIGASNQATSLTSIVLSLGIKILAYVDDKKAGQTFFDCPVLSKNQFLNTYTNENLVIAIGDNAIREKVFFEYKSYLPNANFPALIHQSAVIGYKSSIGDGTVVMPLANVGANSTVGKFCIINTSSSIDHDSSMKSFSSLAPGVVTGGNVKIGTRSVLSVGAVIKHGVTIGNDVVIGANSYVNKTIDDLVLAYGSPCKIISQRRKGDSYL